jgi:hypothetical protein
MRPRTFADVIGQDDTINALRAQWASGRVPSGVLFSGDPGTGKTTLAKILAASVQAPDKFGTPPPEIWDEWGAYPIRETNAAKERGIDEIRRLVEEATYSPPLGMTRVFILNEAQKLTPEAQEALLIPVEEGGPGVLWIIATSAPGKLSAALRRRFIAYQLRPLGPDDIETLIKRAAKLVKFKADLTPFFGVVAEHNVTSPGVLLNAFEKFAVGVPPRKAILAGDTTLDYITGARAFVAGDWRTVRGFLQSADIETTKGFRLMLLAYLRTMLLGGTNSAKCADAIAILGVTTPYDDTFAAWFAAAAYQSIQLFRAK